MNSKDMSYPSNARPYSVIGGTVESRVEFIRKTYGHLAAAIIAFVAFCAMFYAVGVGQAIANVALQGNGMAWLLVLGGFILVGYLAQSLARAERPLSTQYFGLGIYTLAEALIFAPMIYLAAQYYPGVLPSATVVTLTTFIGLTGFVLIYNKDFSYLGSFLAIAGFAALGVIIAGVLFGFNLGIWFSGIMILFAAGAILYSTSNVLHYYRTDQYVAAALDLFAAVALLFWYVLRLFMEMSRRS